MLPLGWDLMLVDILHVADTIAIKNSLMGGELEVELEVSVARYGKVWRFLLLDAARGVGSYIC